MNSREKVIAAIEHRGRGRIPFSVSVHNSLAVHGKSLLDLLHQYPGDFYDPKILEIPEKSKLFEKSKYTDKWGCVWETANILIAGAVTNHPLSDWNDFPNYKMPDIPKVGQKEIDAAEKTRESYPVWAGIDQFFQVMQNIRGSEQLFVDFYTQPEEVQKLIDRMLNENHLPMLKEQLKLKPDIVGTGDDWGTQTSLLVNPEIWNAFFKPVYKKLAEVGHQAGAKIFFHTCGHTMEILEGLIEVGIDVVNPQMPTMDAGEYGRIARGRITVFPDLNRQDILLKGSPEDVKNHIIAMYDKLGTASGGLIGYVPIEPAMPIENIQAMLETVSVYER